MNWYLDVLKKYAVFEGRARRKEYWFFFLFNLLITVGLAIIDGVTGTFNPAFGLGLLSGLYTLAVLIPGIAVQSAGFTILGEADGGSCLLLYHLWEVL